MAFSVHWFSVFLCYWETPVYEVWLQDVADGVMGQKHRARRLEFPLKLGKRDDIHINMLTNRIFLDRIVKQNLYTEIIQNAIWMMRRNYALNKWNKSTVHTETMASSVTSSKNRQVNVTRSSWPQGAEIWDLGRSCKDLQV